MSLGAKLIASYISAGDVGAYVRARLSVDLFLPSERDLFLAVDEHVTSYGAFPSNQALAIALGGFSGHEPAEDVSEYYYEKILRRRIHRGLQKGVQDTAMALNDKKNPRAVLEHLTHVLHELYLRQNPGQLIDFRESAQLLQNQFKQTASQHEGGIRFGWPYLDNMTGGLWPGDLVSYVGRPACLSGSTRLYVARKPKGGGVWYTLEELYRGFNGEKAKKGKGSKYWDLSIPTKVQSLFPDGLTGLHNVQHVVKSGVKATYTVITDTGKSIRATEDHRFFTSAGQYVPLKDLGIGDKIICKAPPITRKRKVPSFRRELCTKLPYSPYGIKEASGHSYHRVGRHRLAYDASQNGMAVNTFVSTLKTQPNHNFSFAPRSHHIHHLDGDVNNNDPVNLECLPSSEHAKLHSQDPGNGRHHFGLNEVQEEVITSIELFGEEMTYDVCMQGGPHNFIANGFVVHNSGKTFNLLYTSLYVWRTQKKPVLFVSMEMIPILILQRLASIHLGVGIGGVMQAAMSTLNLNTFKSGIANLSKEETPFWILDGNLTATAGDLYQYVQQLKPAACFVDGAYLLDYPDKKINEYSKVSENAKILKSQIAGQLGVPVIASYQFNREAARKLKKSQSSSSDEAPGLEDIGYSDAIGQLSSVVLGLLQEETVETDTYRKISVLKGRYGETGTFYVNWNFEKMDFSQSDKSAKDFGYV